MSGADMAIAAGLLALAALIWWALARYAKKEKNDDRPDGWL